jgi:RNA-directed DNA polymerase
LTTAPHRQRPTALRAGTRGHDRASSGHAAAGRPYEPRRQSIHRVAAALGDGFLAAAHWQRGPLLDAGHAVLGARPRWLGPVVTAVLRAYRAAPADRPRELAGFVASIEHSRPARLAPDGVRSRRRVVSQPRVRPAVIRERRVVATRTVHMRWDTPRLDDLAALADFLDLDGDQLDWFADRREINRHAKDQRLRHYRYTWLPHRLIEAPKPRLRALQRRLLDEVLGRLPVHGSAHGFVPGRGVHTFAQPHSGQALVVRADLSAFFSSVTAGRVYGLLRTAGYPEPVAHTLTALTTTRTPADVLRGAPDRGRAALLRQPHLPQGAPSSPALANLCAFRLDRRLTGLAARFGVNYSRYADDLAFSGSLSQHQARHLIARLDRVVVDEGFHLHPAKTRIRGQADRQWLAGLVVNARPAVPRTEYDRLRAVLHDAARHGLDAANRDGHPDFAAHLTGRVAWLSHRHPGRAAKLRDLLAPARQGG